jgi:hypothetical protein
MTKRAMALGGGGPAGIAWETGVIVGMAEALQPMWLPCGSRSFRSAISE